MGIGRLCWALVAAVACASCAPKASLGDARRSVAIIPDDHQLLRRLALADPLGQAVQPDWPMHPAQSRDVASPRFVAPAFSAPSIDDPQGSRAADCLTAAVYYEARSEPLDGQRAVAQVVLNRVRDRAFPNSVCGVVYQRSARGCQFSFACDGSTSRRIEPRAWETARDVAMMALNGSVFAPIGAATHYHTTAILPWWASSLTRIGAIGSHLFYRWRDGLANALSFRQAYSGVETGAAREAVAVAYDGPTPDPSPMSPGQADTSFHQGGVAIHRADFGHHETALAARAALPAAMTIVSGVRIHHGGDGETQGATVAPSAPAAGEAAGVNVN